MGVKWNFKPEGDKITHKSKLYPTPVVRTYFIVILSVEYPIGGLVSGCFGSKEVYHIRKMLD